MNKIDAQVLRTRYVPLFLVRKHAERVNQVQTSANDLNITLTSWENTEETGEAIASLMSTENAVKVSSLLNIDPTDSEVVSVVCTNV